MSNSFKQFLFLGFSLIAMPATLLQAEFTISGTLSTEAPGDILKLQRENLDKRSQSLEGEIIIAEDGNFRKTFDGEAGLFALILSNQKKISLAIQAGQNIEITNHAAAPNSFKIVGSPDTDALQAYEDFRKESLARLVYPPRADLKKANATKQDSEVLGKLAQLEIDAYNEHLKELNDFTIDEIGPSIALYATSLRWDPDHRINELAQTFEAFANANPDLAITQRMHEKLQRFQSIAIGAQAAPLQGKDFDGVEHSLEAHRGKIVLVDFWASWCTPCRIENILYKELHETYSEHGFQIFSVNLDAGSASWKRASKRDQITWPQISDGLAWKSPFAETYNVASLPASFLLDANGRILARNLRGEELEAKLKELLTVQ